MKDTLKDTENGHSHTEVVLPEHLQNVDVHILHAGLIFVTSQKCKFPLRESHIWLYYLALLSHRNAEDAAET